MSEDDDRLCETIDQLNERIRTLEAMLAEAREAVEDSQEYSRNLSDALRRLGIGDADIVDIGIGDMELKAGGIAEPRKEASP